MTVTAKAGDRALTIEEARERIVRNLPLLARTEEVPLLESAGRVLAVPLKALRTQPPFNASAMDGYAVRAADVAHAPATLTVIGESAAGHGFHKPLSAGQAVRIFTGAPIPDGADAIVLQEDARREGDRVTVTSSEIDPSYVRRKGGDFMEGAQHLPAGRRLTARDVTLAAAMGHARLPVYAKPKVALLATGDELVLPGESIGTDQIVCSNVYGIAAMVAAAGGEPRFIGIAQDTAESLMAHVEQAADADILVTIGGASVGDHDLVAPVLTKRGMTLDFWKLAMRPGKPLMYGRLGRQHVLGLPGNPVSSLVCTRLFLTPLVRALIGLEPEPARPLTARTRVPLEANGARAHYMRATLVPGADGLPEVTPVRSQDSSLLTPLSEAACLIVRPIKAPAEPAGATVPILSLDF